MTNCLKLFSLFYNYFYRSIIRIGLFSTTPTTATATAAALSTTIPTRRPTRIYATTTATTTATTATSTTAATNSNRSNYTNTTLIRFCNHLKCIAWNHMDDVEDTSQHQMLAGASSDGRVGIWKWPNATGELHRIIQSHSEAVLCCTWSYMNYNVLFTGSSDQTTKAWQISNVVDHTLIVGLKEDINISTNSTNFNTAKTTTASATAPMNKERKQRKRGKGGGNGNGGRKNGKYPLTSLEVEVIECNQLARVLRSRMNTGTMTLELIALSPSCGMWKECVESYVLVLEREGRDVKRWRHAIE